MFSLLEALIIFTASLIKDTGEISFAHKLAWNGLHRWNVWAGWTLLCFLCTVEKNDANLYLLKYLLKWLFSNLIPLFMMNLNVRQSDNITLSLSICKWASERFIHFTIAARVSKPRDTLLQRILVCSNSLLTCFNVTSLQCHRLFVL